MSIKKKIGLIVIALILIIIAMIVLNPSLIDRFMEGFRAGYSG